MNISLLITILAYVILILSLVVGFLLGLKRGVVKSSIRLGTFIGLMIIAGLITAPISKALITIDISGLNWTVGGEVVQTFPQAINNLLLSNSQLATAAESMPSIMNLIDGLPVAIINIIVFFILVLLMLLISWIVYFIIAKTALRQSRLERKAKKLKKQEAKTGAEGQLIKPDSPSVMVPKKKLYRWWGAGIGLINGFIFIFLLLLPITSLTSTVTEIASANLNTSSVHAEGEILTETSSDLVRYYVGDEILSYVSAYSDSVAGKILTIGGFDDVIFDALTSVNVNKQNFAFRHDVLNLTKVYDECVYFVDEVGRAPNYKNINFNKIENIADKLFSMGIFKILAPEALPYALTFLYDSETFANLEYKVEIQEALDSVVDGLKTNSEGFIETLRKDVSSLIDVGKAACSVGFVDDLVGGKRGYTDFISALSSENYLLLNSLTKNISSSTSLKLLASNGMSAGFSIAEDKLDNAVYFGRINSNSVDWKGFEPDLNSFLKNAIEAFNILNKYDFESIISNPKFIVSTEFSNSDFNSLILILGKELQLLKENNLFTSQEINPYNEIVDFASSKEAINNFIDAVYLKKINWEQEIYLISPSLNSLKQSEVLSYIFDGNIQVEILCEKLLLGETPESNSYARTILTPLLNSKLSQKPIKYALELANENLSYLREKIGPEVESINLENFTYLSVNDKAELINLVESAGTLIVNMGYDGFINDTLNTIFALNDFNGGNINSNYVVEVLKTLSKIEIISPTFNSVLVAAGNNNSIKDYLTPQNATQEKFDWEEEVIIINTILSVLEKESNGESVKTILYPNNSFEGISINNELISKVFKHVLLPFSQTSPESGINVLVSSLYESKLMKKSLAYLINTLNQKVCEVISAEGETVETSKLSLDMFTQSQKEQIINVLESLARGFDVLTKQNFSIDSLSEQEIELVGSFLNSLKENAYCYSEGVANPNCTLSEDGKTVVGGGVFADLYISMINYAKKSFEFSGTVSYGNIEWINFLKTAKKLSEISNGNGNILDIISNPDSGVNVGEVLEIIGVGEETSNKISDVQNGFSNINSNSPETFENLANSLGNITQEDADIISNVVYSSTGSDISSSIDLTVIEKEQIVSSTISLLMSNILIAGQEPQGITDENLSSSLTNLCNGSTFVLSQAISNGVVLNCNITGGTSQLSIEIDAATSDLNIRNLVKTLFGIY